MAHAAPGAASTDDLLQQFRAAFNKKDVSALMAMFYAEGAPLEVQRMNEGMLKAMVQSKLSGLTIGPAAADDDKEYVRDGVTYRPTLKPTNSLKLAFADSGHGASGISFMVGSKDGAYYLVTSAADPVSGKSAATAPAPPMMVSRPEGTLGITIWTGGFSGTALLNKLDGCPFGPMASHPGITNSVSCIAMQNKVKDGDNTLEVTFERTAEAVAGNPQLKILLSLFPSEAAAIKELMKWDLSAEKPGTKIIHFNYPPAGKGKAMAAKTAKLSVVELEQTMEACANEAGLFCGKFREQPEESILCLKKHAADLLEPCRKRLDLPPAP